MSRFPWFGLLLLAGCTPTTSKVETPAPRVELGARFDAAATSTVRGQVLWHGSVPGQERAVGVVPDGDEYRVRDVGNPFRLAVDPATRGLAGVLVALDGIDPARSRAWDHSPVALTMTDFNFRLSQGDRATAGPGLVRLGDSVTFVSNDAELHVLRARGAAFFALTFPAPAQPRTRRFDTSGIVELTSGAGYFWNAADLCVRADPYAEVTDAQGRYEFKHVPEGAYTLTTRFRDPTVTRVERDPETGLPFRHYYAPPRVRSSPVTVTRNVDTRAPETEIMP